MPRIQVVEEENAEGKVKVVYDQLRSVFGKVPSVMKALSPWPEVLELYATRIGLMVFSETLLTRAVKEMIASLVSRINECNYCVTYHKSFFGGYRHFISRSRSHCRGLSYSCYH